MPFRREGSWVSAQDSLRHAQNRLRAQQEGRALFSLSGAEPGDVVAVLYKHEGRVQPTRYGMLSVKGALDNPLEIYVDGKRIKFRNLLGIEIIQKNTPVP